MDSKGVIYTLQVSHSGVYTSMNTEKNLVAFFSFFETVLQSIPGPLSESIPGPLSAKKKEKRTDRREKNVQTNPIHTYCKRNMPLLYNHPN